VMAAAVADFRPAQVSAAKIKKGPDSRDDAPTIELVRNDDVLAGAVRARAHGELPNMRAIVGFAAETGDADASVLEHGRAKLARKGCDLLVVNEVGDGLGFETERNDVVILAADGSEPTTAHGSKSVVAAAVWDRVVALLAVADAR